MKKYLIPLLLTGLAACSGSEETANERNLSKAIKRYNADHPVCVNIPLASEENTQKIVLGDEIVWIDEKDKAGKKVNHDLIKQFEILGKKDIYKKEKAPKAQKGDIPKRRYVLTEKGQSLMGEKPNALCIAEQKVEKIMWFSAPAVRNGLLGTTVSYQTQNIIDSDYKKLIKLGNNKALDSIEAQSTEQVRLILSNHGWMDARNIQ